VHRARDRREEPLVVDRGRPSRPRPQKGRPRRPAPPGPARRAGAECPGCQPRSQRRCPRSGCRPSSRTIGTGSPRRSHRPPDQRPFALSERRRASRRHGCTQPDRPDSPAHRRPGSGKCCHPDERTGRLPGRDPTRNGSRQARGRARSPARREPPGERAGRVRPIRRRSPRRRPGGAASKHVAGGSTITPRRPRSAARFGSGGEHDRSSRSGQPSPRGDSPRRRPPPSSGRPRHAGAADSSPGSGRLAHTRCPPSGRARWRSCSARRAWRRPSPGRCGRPADPTARWTAALAHGSSHPTATRCSPASRRRSGGSRP
jgi:hypothetical protein